MNIQFWRAYSTVNCVGMNPESHDEYSVLCGHIMIHVGDIIIMRTVGGIYSTTDSQETEYQARAQRCLSTRPRAPEAMQGGGGRSNNFRAKQ